MFSRTRGFVKEEKQSIKNLISEKSKQLDDNINVVRYITSTWWHLVVYG